MPVRNLQAVRQAVVDARSGHNAVCHLVKAAGHHADLPAAAVRLGHELPGTRCERHACVGAVEHALVKTCEQPHAFLERLGKVKLASHGAFRDTRNALACARLVAKQVDDLLVDERGVDVHDDEAHFGACGGHALLHDVVVHDEALADARFHGIDHVEALSAVAADAQLVVLVHREVHRAQAALAA